VLFLDFDVDALNLSTWLPVGVGLLVAGLVLLIAYLRARRRRRLAFASYEEDLPWDQMLKLLREHRSGGEAEQELPPEQLLKLLLTRLDEMPAHRRADAGPGEGGGIPPRGADWRGPERRKRSRRGGAPTPVVLSSSTPAMNLRGVVLNRSTGGLAIVVKEKVEPGSILMIRAAEAPRFVPQVPVEIKHCELVSGCFVLGCEFQEDVPWNARVWFG
jgi:hypothetical protein